ncbi:MAG: phosphatase PAP2 family protein [Bacteroidia bacterium]|jgi:membrane-associated phospholipid phosphatase|nr:phosphatase PAP2 family protein [Bacteroidia bacterium]
MRITLLLFAFACFLTFSLPAQNADINLLRRIHVNRNVRFDGFMKGMSNSMAPACVVVPGGLLVHSLMKCDSVRQKRFWLVGSSMAVSTVITVGLKYGINRKRPYVTYNDIIPQQHTGPYSFPSGHTSSAFALATSVTMAFPKWYVAAPAFVWAGAVAYSRMHLGVHYPGDVIAGALIGAGSVWLCWQLNQWILKNGAGLFRKNC